MILSGSIPRAPALVKGLSRAGASVLIAVTLALGSIAPAAAEETKALSSQTALDWNLNAVTAVRAARTMDGVAQGGAPRPLYQAEGLLYVAYVQAAIYDAVMKISHRYALYHHFSAPAGNASPDAAVIAAAYRTLVFYLGDPNNSLAGKYSAAIAALPQDAQTLRGIQVGEAAAADIEQLRAADGRNAAISDACPTDTTPGAWQCPPPPSIQSEQTPWLAVMQPFMLAGASQFRAPAPPVVGSSQYNADFNETKSFGASNSTVRTADETATALFWNANAISQFNQTLRDEAVQHNLDLVDAVRLLAAGIMVSTDAGIACFDSKYHYMFWRPVTAIRADGVAADATWTPLATTPNHPEYPAQHGCATSALMQTLAAVLGTNQINVTVLGGPPSGTTLVPRTFGTPQDVETELVNARVWIGFHYRNSVIQGENIGNSVAQWTLARFFQPLDDEIDTD